ncbi:hypothetical protein [Kitasatospora sp. NPDC006786]|uniref:hypothetical protein n=1 Tax=unclassified Kitasatospora TaxID=2633591 RepID=UPI0033EB4DA8
MRLPVTASLTDVRDAVPQEWRPVFDAELSRVLLSDLTTWAWGWARSVEDGDYPPRPYP